MRWNPNWEDVFRRQEWGKYPPEDLIRFVAEHFYGHSDRRSLKFLEIGCGPGANVWYMAREGFTAVGLEGSPTAVKKGRLRLRSEKLPGNLLIGDAAALPFRGETFDVVIDCECLSCNSFSDSRIILEETRRVLKKKGILYSKTFADDNYVGKNFVKTNSCEFSQMSDGPLSASGFVRLTPKKHIGELYGNFFKILSVDRMERTCRNGAIKVSEWIIICKR